VESFYNWDELYGKCRSHVLDYEKKSQRMTWLRCILCGTIVGWLEDNTPRVEGKVARLDYKEKEKLK
jgi:hypothetical protein